MTLYLDATHAKKTKRPPIWMMRQAGRHLPEYRALREKYSFMEMMKTPDLATKITLQPIKRYGFDAAILFSDILTVAESLGGLLRFVDKKGPVISNPIRTQKDLDTLLSQRYQPISTYASFVYQTIKQLKPELNALNVPLIGFSGAPFTVASYMVEGGSSPDLKETKRLIGHTPDVLHQLLKKLTSETIHYLSDQIKAGVDAIQIFDTWAGHLSFDDFTTFALPYTKDIVAQLKATHPHIPISLFSRHSTTFSPSLCQLPINVISLDWQTDLNWAKATIPKHIAIQGNLDPGLLLASPDILIQRVQTILTTMADRPGYIFNLGHGITPDVPVDNVKQVVECVKNWQKTDPF
jgi:uroporphyrinogen decarboxylase